MLIHGKFLFSPKHILMEHPQALCIKKYFMHDFDNLINRVPSIYVGLIPLHSDIGSCFQSYLTLNYFVL